MRFFLISVFILAYPRADWAQGFRSRVYLPGNYDCLTRAIFETSPGHYFGAGFSDRLTIMGLDSIGQAVWVKKYGNAKFTYLPNIFNRRSFYKQGNFIYHACCVKDSNNKQIGALLKFDQNGDTVWQKVYRDTAEDVITQMVTGSVDGGFLITGFFQNWVTPARPCLLIKTDALGNELWRRRIHKPNQDVSEGKAIVQDSASKRIVIAGQMYYYASDLYDHMLILDSLGNNPVRKTYVRAGGIAYDMIQARDKKFVVVGADYEGTVTQAGSLSNSYIVKFDINNPTTPLWKVLLDTMTTANYFGCVRELANGDYLIAGVIDTLGDVGKPYNALIRMTKVDAGGVVKYNRYYNYKINGPAADNILRLSSLELCADGSWLSSIEVVNFNKPNPFFFVKFDSGGCDTISSYCLQNYTTAIQTTTTAPVYTTTPPAGTTSLVSHELKAFEIFPNPVSEMLNVKLELLDEDYRLELLDIYGKKQKRLRLVNGEQSINLKDLAPGIYFLQVYKNEQFLDARKMIKE